MKRLFRITLPVGLAILVNLLTLGAHGSAAAATSSHSSHGTSHSTVSSLSCISICTASTPQKLKVVIVDNEDDDDNTSPFYVAEQQSIAQAFDEKHAGQTKAALSFTPPPGPPLYVLNAVLRF